MLLREPEVEGRGQAISDHEPCKLGCNAVQADPFRCRTLTCVSMYAQVKVNVIHCLTSASRSLAVAGAIMHQICNTMTTLSGSPHAWNSCTDARSLQAVEIAESLD